MTPSSPVATRILVLAAHPDDEVVGVAESITRARAEGARVCVAYLSDGVPAPEVLWPWQRGQRAQRVAIRLREADAVAERLGLECVWRQALPSRALRLNARSTLAALEALCAELRPMRVWVPAYEGGHQDHDVANWLGSRLKAHAPVWEYAEYRLEAGKTVCNRFRVRTGREQTVALSAERAAVKQGLLDLYHSERGNLGYVTTVQEELRPLHAYDYSEPPHPGRTFYQRFQWVPAHPRIDYTRPAEVCEALRQLESALESEAEQSGPER